MALRTLRILLWALVAMAGVAAIWFFVLAPRLAGSMQETLGKGDYDLQATDGSTFSEAALKGHPSAVFFGFTHCPEVCPTTLGEIGAWTEELGPDAEDLRIWFVTVDPERDSLDMLEQYISWTPGVVGASGSADEVAKAIESFKIFTRKVPLNDGGYTMDHSTYVMLFDRNGRFDQVIAYREPIDSAVAKLRRLISLG